jgi:hypothetical protein
LRHARQGPQPGHRIRNNDAITGNSSNGANNVNNRIAGKHSNDVNAVIPVKPVIAVKRVKSVNAGIACIDVNASNNVIFVNEEA